MGSTVRGLLERLRDARPSHTVEAVGSSSGGLTLRAVRSQDSLEAFGRSLEAFGRSQAPAALAAVPVGPARE